MRAKSVIEPQHREDIYQRVLEDLASLEIEETSERVFITAARAAVEMAHDRYTDARGQA